MKGNLIIEKLHLVEFKLLKGQIESPYGITNETIDGYQFEVGFDVGFNIEQKLIKADLQIKIDVKNRDENAEEKASGFFQFLYVYRVDNLVDLVEESPDKKSLLIHHNLANAVSSISYSTSRGVLLTRFQGTILSDFILPVMDPNKLIEKI